MAAWTVTHYTYCILASDSCHPTLNVKPYSVTQWHAHYMLAQATGWQHLPSHISCLPQAVKRSTIYYVLHTLLAIQRAISVQLRHIPRRKTVESVDIHQRHAPLPSKLHNVRYITTPSHTKIIYSWDMSDWQWIRLRQTIHIYLVKSATHDNLHFTMKMSNTWTPPNSTKSKLPLKTNGTIVPATAWFLDQLRSRWAQNWTCVSCKHRRNALWRYCCKANRSSKQFRSLAVIKHQTAHSELQADNIKWSAGVAKFIRVMKSTSSAVLVTVQDCCVYVLGCKQTSSTASECKAQPMQWKVKR